MPDRIPTIFGVGSVLHAVVRRDFRFLWNALELKAMAVVSPHWIPGPYQGHGQRNVAIHVPDCLELQPYYQFICRWASGSDRIGDAAARYLLDSYPYEDWVLTGHSLLQLRNRKCQQSHSQGRRIKEFWDIYPFLPREAPVMCRLCSGLYTMRYYSEHNIASSV